MTVPLKTLLCHGRSEAMDKQEGEQEKERQRQQEKCGVGKILERRQLRVIAENRESYWNDLLARLAAMVEKFNGRCAPEQIVQPQNQPAGVMAWTREKSFPVVHVLLTHKERGIEVRTTVTKAQTAGEKPQLLFLDYYVGAGQQLGLILKGQACLDDGDIAEIVLQPLMGHCLISSLVDWLGGIPHSIE
jgi:hypothetical protein